jgi:hypothetical protein
MQQHTPTPLPAFAPEIAAGPFPRSRPPLGAGATLWILKVGPLLGAGIALGLLWVIIAQSGILGAYLSLTLFTIIVGAAGLQILRGQLVQVAVLCDCLFAWCRPAA